MKFCFLLYVVGEFWVLWVIVYLWGWVIGFESWVSELCFLCGNGGFLFVHLGWRISYFKIVIIAKFIVDQAQISGSVVSLIVCGVMFFWLASWRA